MSDDKSLASKLKMTISELELEVARLKNENKFLKENTSISGFGQEDIFSLRQIITLMPGNVYWKNRDGVYLGCNNNLAHNLRLSCPEEIIGKKNSDLMNPDLAKYLDDIDNEVINLVRARHFEEIGFDSDGKKAIFFTNKLPLCDGNNNVAGLLGISINITAQKKIEEELNIAKEKAEESNRAKSQFLAVVNHELRTPLTGIIGLAEMLKRGHPSSKDEKETLNNLIGCAEYLHTLVNDILDFTKLDAGKTPLNRHKTNPKSIANDVANMLTVLSTKKGLDLRVQLEENIPLLFTDSRILRQILINLTSNAIKFTEKGFVAIRINCKSRSANKAILELSIQDTGFGIPHDQLSQIFKPFRQLEDTYIRQSSRSGTGLGLAIVKRLATLLNCEIHVISEYGKGSTFSLVGEFDVLSDIQIADIEKETVELKTLNTSRPSHHKIKTLIIEDDKIVQLIHKNMLSELGCIVDVSDCGKDALKKLNKHEIIFVDIGLSDMTGFELISRIRQQRDPNMPHLPIIALTGYTGDEEQEACLLAGADEVAAKPITSAQLEDILLRHIKSNIKS